MEKESFWRSPYRLNRRETLHSAAAALTLLFGGRLLGCAGTAEAKENSRRAERIQTLLRCGFDQVGESNVFQFHDFFISVDENGGYEFFAKNNTETEAPLTLVPLVGPQAQNLTKDTEILSCRKKEENNERTAFLEVSNGMVHFTYEIYKPSWLSNHNIVFADGSAEFLRELSPEETGVRHPDVVVESTGFKIGGVNSTNLIKRLPGIKGEPIRRIEERIKKHYGCGTRIHSEHARESLRDILARDNDFVLSHGLTHQDMAEPVQYVMALATKGFTDFSFPYHGSQYTVSTGLPNKCSERSPFKDGEYGVLTDIFLRNLTNGHAITFSSLFPGMAAKYGFYEPPHHSREHYPSTPAALMKVFPHVQTLGKERPKSQ